MTTPEPGDVPWWRRGRSPDGPQFPHGNPWEIFRESAQEAQESWANVVDELSSAEAMWIRALELAEFAHAASETAMRRAVREARRGSVPWHMIGDALHVSAEEARRRFGGAP